MFLFGFSCISFVQCTLYNRRNRHCKWMCVIKTSVQLMRENKLILTHKSPPFMISEWSCKLHFTICITFKSQSSRISIKQFTSRRESEFLIGLLAKRSPTSRQSPSGGKLNTCKLLLMPRWWQASNLFMIEIAFHSKGKQIFLRCFDF